MPGKRVLKLDPLGEESDMESDTLLESKSLKIYSQRWLVLLCYWLLALSNNATQGCLVPVSQKAIEWFNISPYQLDFLVVIHSISGISWRWVCMYVLDTKKYGLGVGIHTAAALNVAGCLFYYFGGSSREGYPLLVLGACLCAMAQGFIDIAPTKISAAWFPVEERSLATAIGALSIMLASTFPYLTAPWVIKKDPETEFPVYFLIILIFAGCSALLTFVVFKAKPPSPPSLSAAEDRSSFGETVRGVFRNRNFIVVLILFCTMAASSAAFHTLFGQVFGQVFNGVAMYDGPQIGYLGGVPILSGILGAIIVGKLLDKYHKYKEVLLVLAAGSTVLYAWMALILAPGHFTQLIINRVLYGLTGVALVPAAFESLVEISYPYPEATVMGIVFWFMNLFIIVDTYVFQYVAGVSSWAVVIWIIFGLNSIACFIGWKWFDGVFKRLEFDTHAE